MLRHRPPRLPPPTASAPRCTPPSPQSLLSGHGTRCGGSIGGGGGGGTPFVGASCAPRRAPPPCGQSTA
eukprot:485820-Pleurochrysis_carterae.AAC.2